MLLKSVGATMNRFEEITMFKLPAKLKISLISLLYGMMVSVPAVADDIEIYTSAGATTTSNQANVLFVLDTSGSMGNPVVTRPPYDPTTDYSGGGACYNNNRVYIMPYGADNAWIHCDPWWSWWYGTEASLSQVKRPAVVCDAAGSLDVTGFYTGRVSQYRSSSWRDSITNNNVDNFVECEVDNGVHGETTGNSKVWASSSNGPWSSSEPDSINWGGVGLSTALYSGRYLNYIINAPVTTSSTRIKVMQDVITDLLQSTTGVNVGLMRFSQNGEGGMMAVPIDDIATNKTTLITELNKMTASGGTPLSESFYEAAMYFQGKSVDYGNNSTPFKSVSSSKSGGNYKSPIADECQKNFVILLTDGEPTGDSLSASRRSRLNIASCSGNCLDEIAQSIGTNDQSSAVTGDQFLSTFTIGFAIDNQLLKDTARESFVATGVGERYLADDAATLADTLNNIFANIDDQDTTFSSPAVSVNAFNRATHLDELYFTLFKPSTGTHWPGNFKKYKLTFFVDTTDIDNDGDTTERLPMVADAAGVNAIDATGFFSKTSKSYWSDGVDGADVTAGGAANEFTNSRKVYTYTGTYNNSAGVFTPPVASAALTSTANVVDKTNTAITEAMLGIVGQPQKIAGTDRIDTLLDWAKGLDVFDDYGAVGTTTDPRPEMGDPLHSEPALVQYGDVAGVPDLVAYIATNDGYLHAIDVGDSANPADGGNELFSFIPQELLTNLNVLMDNNTATKTYGLDGNVVAWINDANKDGTISGAGEHVYLYIGMRRGGNNIYSIDVTDRNNPTLRWVIKGGSGDYAELGQTWSSINVEKIKDGNTEKTVLIFGGGYDTNQDNITVRSATGDSVGRAVYIADATSGDMLWSAGAGGTLPLSDMKYSIPARVKPLDIKGDGFIDRLYVADTGGQIFRFDIDNKNGVALAGSITGGRIADLSVDNSTADARRFYYPPDVALISERGKSAYLALAISSGYRAHPNDTGIHDRIYLLKDNDVYNVPASYVTLTEADLYNATLNLVAGDGDAAQNDAAKAALATTDGWYIFLDDETPAGNWLGEKGLSEALILEGTVIVTTYVPNTSGAASACSPKSGIGKVFVMDVLDASPVLGAATDKRPGRHLYGGLAKGGIPPTPNVVVTKGGEPTLCVGTECKAADLIKGVRGTFWNEVEK
ncbi:MAG TPA: pilus assembly protein PilY [Gammaproteobacteria bacterium]|nr:pilus assembly protein PilY [Gammaproteobacteria bacterium]